MADKKAPAAAAVPATHAEKAVAPAPVKSIPRPADFFLTVPVYSKTVFDGLETWKIIDVLYYRSTYDAYCPKCKRDSTFRVVGPDRPPEYVRNHQRERLKLAQGIDTTPELRDGVYVVHAECARNQYHTHDFIFSVETRNYLDDDLEPKRERTFEKIGQRPSYGDLHRAEVKQYASVLTETQLAEFTRAISLASHDVGIASYVYLRRIFEGLIEEAHQIAKKEHDWDEKAYVDMRMTDRIPRLSHHLPTFLVEHASMYGLLSKGIHELSEEECLKHFDTLRIAIELVLDEKLEKKQKETKTKAAKAAIQAALSEANAPKKA